jgi:hypothetical protein
MHTFFVELFDTGMILHDIVGSLHSLSFAHSLKAIVTPHPSSKPSAAFASVTVQTFDLHTKTPWAV